MARRKPTTEDTTRFSKKWFMDGLRNLFWVVVVTALIWVYADMEFADTATVAVILKLNTGEAGQLELMSEKEIPLKFDISGSKSSLEEFERELANKGSVFSYDVSQNYEAGDNPVPAVDLLEAVTKLREKGITIKNVQPAAIELKLDTIMLIPDVTVKLQTTGATLAPPPADQKVDIRVPASRWKLIKEKLNGKPPTLETTPVNLKDLKPGISKKVEATVLQTIEGISVIPVHEKVTFNVRIIRTSEIQTIPVSVQILTPAAWADTTWQDYILNRQAPADWRLKLEVEGPKQELKSENVIAYIQLTDEDKKPITSWLEREVIISFPPETNLKLIGSKPKLTFRLDQRKTTSPTP